MEDLLAKGAELQESNSRWWRTPELARVRSHHRPWPWADLGEERFLDFRRKAEALPLPAPAGAAAREPRAVGGFTTGALAQSGWGENSTISLFPCPPIPVSAPAGQSKLKTKGQGGLQTQGKKWVPEQGGGWIWGGEWRIELFPVCAQFLRETSTESFGLFCLSCLWLTVLKPHPFQESHHK